MTCIVGLVYEGRVYLGGDSAAVEPTSFTALVRADEKVFARGPYLMGFTSSFRMGQLLRYAGELPIPPVEMKDLHGFMCTGFIDAVRAIFKEGGFTQKDAEAAEMGGEFLVSVRGKLFAIHSDFQVAESVDGYMAVGCGAQLAMGALYATRDKQDPEQRIRIALEAAEKFNAGVRSPFIIRTEDANQRRWGKN